MKKKLWFITSVLLSLMLLMTGCFNSTDTSSSKSDKNSNVTKKEVKILRANSSSEPGSLHPGTAEGTHDSWILDHTFEGLATKTPEGEIVPGMAEDWEISEDKLTYTFTLKDGLKWSNGDPILASDFEYAWKFALNPNTASTYAYQLYYLEGAEEFNSLGAEERAKAAEEERDPVPVSEEEVASFRDKVGVKALDEKTLEVKLKEPTPYFLDVTTHYTYYPVNQKVAEANPDWFKEASTFVSNGPFKLEEWNHKENIKLSKNENYYGKDNIKIDGINFTLIAEENTAWQMYKSGELDIVYPLPQEVQGQLMKEKAPDFHLGPDLALYYLHINNTVKPFNNMKVRKALALAIDRKTITEHVAQGGQTPAYSIVPPGILDENGDFNENSGKLFEENIEEAKNLLKEGLEEEGMDKLPNFVYTYNTSDGHKAIGEAIQEMWRKNLGVETTLENVEFQVKLDKEKAGDFVISRGGWVGDYVDPMTFMDIWVTGGSQNSSLWSNKEYDRLIATAKSTFDTGIRMEAMHEAEKIAIEEFPVIPIYFYTKPYVVKENVTGVYTPINRYPQLELSEIK